MDDTSNLGPGERRNLPARSDEGGPAEWAPEHPREADHPPQADHRHAPDSAGGRRSRNGAHNSRRANRTTHHIPSRDAILASLARIPQLVAANILTSAQSNAMVQALTTLLRFHPADAPGRSATLDATSLEDTLRQHPDLLNVLAPLLSEEQLAELTGANGVDDVDEDIEATDDDAKNDEPR